MALDKEIKVILSAQDNASAALRQVGSSLGALEDAGRRLLATLGPLAGALAVREIVETSLQFERYKNALIAITGSADGASREMEYVRSIANELGISLEATAESWVKFSAATKGTAIAGDEARRIFESVATAARVLGLDADTTRGVFLALEQMLSKGKVSAEELRGQLGERLPGAFRLMAQALGVTTPELDKMLQTGHVLATEALPKFATELEKAFGGGKEIAISSASAAVERFGNKVTELKLQLADAGILDTVVNSMEALGQAISDPRVVQSIANMGQSFEAIASGSGPAMITALEGMVKLFQALAIGSQVVITALQLIGDVLAAVAAAAVSAAQGDFKTAWAILQDPTPANNFNKNLDALEKSTAAFWGSATQAASGVKTLGEENKTTTKTLADYEAEVRKAAGSTTAQADATKKSAEEAKKAAVELEKQRIEAAKLAVEIEKIASNERIKKIEFAVGLKTEQIKADVEVAKAIIGTIDTTIKSTGDLLGSLFGNLKGAGSFGEKWAIEDQIKLENQRREEALKLQKDLTQAQIDALKSRTEMMNRGEAMIKMTLDGVEPELEMIMWKIVERLQTRVNEELASFLIGVAPA